VNARQRRVARRKAGRKTLHDAAILERLDRAREQVKRGLTAQPLPECSHLWIAETRTLDCCVRCGEVK